MNTTQLSTLKRKLVEEVLKFLSELGVEEIDRELYDEIVNVCCELVETAFRYGALKRALTRLIAHALAESLGKVDEERLAMYYKLLSSEDNVIRGMRNVLEMAMKLGSLAYS